MTVNEDGSGELSAELAEIKLLSSVPRYASQVLGNGYERIYYRFSLLGIDAPKKGGLLSHGVYLENYTSETGHFYTTSTDFVVFLPTNGQTVAYLDAQEQAGTPVQIVYPLATPLVYHFDNLEQLTTVLGTNNIWVDCGQTTAEYRADTKLYIDKKLAALVAALS